MILTNKLGLPRSIYEAVKNDPYTKGDAHISVTGLIAPARQCELAWRHRDELTEDVSDRIWSLVGQIGHGILERAQDNALTEERLYVTRHGWKISGKFDRFVLEDGRLGDFKFTSVYTIKDGAKPEHEAQLNLYALMLREHGYTVNALEIIAILRDWSKAKARSSDYYPPHQVVVLPVPMWEPARTEAYIVDRLTAHGRAQTELPECTAEERWERPGAFSLCKVGNQRATSTHDTAEEAVAALDAAKAKNPKAEYFIKELPPISVRCADYCAVSEVCDLWKRINPRPLKI